MKNQPEYNLQKSLCSYLRWKYRDVFFLSDTVASIALSIPQQVRNKAIQNPDFHCPDLLILEPKKGFCALFLELKIKTPFKSDGSLLKNEHLAKQYDTLVKLNDKGYKAMFVWSYDMGVNIIDEYLM